MHHNTATPTLLAALLLFPAMGASQVQAARADDDVEWAGIHSDTTGQFVSPMAPMAGESFTLSLRAFANDLTSVRARLWFSGPDQEIFTDLTPKSALPGAAFTTWETTVSPPQGTTAVYWRFEVTDGATTAHYDAGVYGDNPLYRGMSGAFRGNDNNFQLPIGFNTPDWSKEAIWYQVFPERFYDGDASNNHMATDDALWYLDWAPEGTDTGKDCEFHDDWNASPTGPCDFYGGDLNGVTDKLAYLDSLNVNALYLNPVFRSRSNHKYDTMDYETVDPRFGGLEALEGVAAGARDLGWKVILDGVFNHTSDQSIYYNGYPDLEDDPFYPSTIGVWEDAFLDLGTSPWDGWFKVWGAADYYDVDRDGDLEENALHTCGWYGFEFMPNFDFKSPSQPNSAPRTWLYGGNQADILAAAKSSIAGTWLADNASMDIGLDGWRLDVPDNAGYSIGAGSDDCSWTSNDETIWQGFRTASKTANPEAYITGEIWTDASNSNGQNWFFNGTFDAVMNYHYFAMPLTCYLNGSGVHEAQVGSFGEECFDAYALVKKGVASDLENLDAHLAQQRRVYPASAYMANQNLISSHDTARWISRIGADEDTLINAYFWQATVPGAPMVYYGDEIGLEGMNDPDNRRTFPWSQVDGTAETARREILSDLLCVRGAHSALATGSWKTLEANSNSDIYSFARWSDDETLLVSLNNSNISRTVQFNTAVAGIENGQTLIDALTGDEVSVAGGIASVNVPAHRGVILIPQDHASASDACRDTQSPPANNPPVADAGPSPITFASDESVVLDGSASFDPDGDSLTYVWKNEAGGTIGSSAIVTLPPQAPGSYIFSLTVSDGMLTDGDTVEVLVESGGEGCDTSGGGSQGLLALLALLLPLGLRRRNERGQL